VLVTVVEQRDNKCIQYATGVVSTNEIADELATSVARGTQETHAVLCDPHYGHTDVKFGLAACQVTSVQLYMITAM
jgi:hypothetical protein